MKTQSEICSYGTFDLCYLLTIAGVGFVGDRVFPSFKKYLRISIWKIYEFSIISNESSTLLKVSDMFSSSTDIRIIWRFELKSRKNSIRQFKKDGGLSRGCCC